MSESGVTIEQEIVQLEQQIAEKRISHLADLGQEKVEPKLPPDKETLHEIIGEKIQQSAPPAVGEARQGRQYQPLPTKPQHDDSTLSYVLPELKDKVQELVNLVFNKSLEDGIKEVAKTNNAALIDAFHDVLVDELYNILVERKKLEPVK